MKISLNGKLLDEQEAVISIFDHGFLYGMGLFETFRTYQGRPFLLTDHLTRLREACALIQIDYCPKREEIEARLLELLEANHLNDAYFRLTVTGGIKHLGLPLNAYDQPQEIIYTKTLPARDNGLYKKGKPLQLLRHRRNSPEGDYRFKSLHYMNSIMGKQELQRYPWAQQAEGLFLNEKGALAEGIVSNIFFVRKGICCTPSIDTGILGGVTRRFVLSSCEQLGIPLEEGHYHWEDLIDAEEIFITNSIQEIVPISKLFDTEGRTVEKSNLLNDSYTTQLMRFYEQQVSITE
jgi:4-amino-4-deoxychorismate lyase